MQATSRSHVLAAAALAAVSAMVVTPIVARQAPLNTRQADVKLVDVSVDNIPVNLFDDILNIPYNELEGGGLATVGNSFLFTGTWWVPSSTNIWGIDPGDPTHIALIDDFIPFTAFTEGFTNSSGVYEPGLNYEFAGLLASELPNSSSCDAITCYPMTPPDVITGSTQFDRDIGFFESLFGKAMDANGDPNGLFTDFFQVPISDLVNGYPFQAPPAGTDATTGEPTYDTGVINPAGEVNDAWAQELGWGSTGDPFEGGTKTVDGVVYNPWEGVDFHLNLFQPFQTLIDSLEQTPSTTGIDGTGIEPLSFEGIAHTFENLEAGLIIDFDPFTEGSPACPAACDYLPSGTTIPELVEDIAKSDPTNTVLADWVKDYNTDPTLVNEPTQAEINSSVALLQTGIYNLDPKELADVDTGYASINPELPQLLTNAGFYTDPDYLPYGQPGDPVYTYSGALQTEYGGYNPLETFNDLYKLFTNGETNYSELGNYNLLQFLADPVTSPDPYNGNVPDGEPWYEAIFHTAATGGTAASVGAGSAASEFSSDMSSLLAGFGTTAGADAISAALSDISAQISADLASIVPQSVLSLF